MSSEAKADSVISTPDVKPSSSAVTRYRRFKKSNTVRQTRFEGRCEALQGHVYECTNFKQSDQFAKTTKEIADYVGKTYKYGGTMRNAVLSLAHPTVEEPMEPKDESSRLQMRKWEKEVDEYVKKSYWIKEHVQSLFSLVWGQCSDAMRQKIESLGNYYELSSSSNGIDLLVTIRDAAFDYQSQKYRIETINEALRRILTFRQGPTMTTQEFYEQFLNKIEVYIHQGGSVEPHPGSVVTLANENGWDINNLTKTEKSMAKEAEWANIFIINSDRVRYGSLLISLQNEFLNGCNKYPKTLNEAYNRLTYWREEKSTNQYSIANDGVTFAHTGGESDIVLATEEKVRKGKFRTKEITCHKCGEKGHYANQCNKATGEQLLISGIEDGEFDSYEDGFLLQTSHGSTIPDTWILLDNQSTIDVFKSKKLLADITKSPNTMTINCNAGSATTNQVGELPGYGQVWYHPSGIANILSLARVREKGFKVEYDHDRNCFTIMKDGDKPHVFYQSPRGLYFLDTSQVEGHLLVSTVENNKSKFSQRDYLQAVKARQIMRIIGYPSLQQYLAILDNKQIPNCPITRRDAINAEIFLVLILTH